MIDVNDEPIEPIEDKGTQEDISEGDPLEPTSGAVEEHEKFTSNSAASEIEALEEELENIKGKI